jgi:hypothetical protein
LAGVFGPDREWTLIGGLMVQLHAFEREDEPRPTADIDLVGGAKRPPRMTEAMASLLVERGAEIAEPPRSSPELGYRFEIEGETVELLGPDGLRGDPKTISGLKTFQAAGGSQALRRTEVVLVSLDGGEPVAVRRPNLLGAILIKARVLVKKRERKYESDREDLVRLLTYVDEARALAAAMSRKEPRWLRDAQAGSTSRTRCCRRSSARRASVGPGRRCGSSLRSRRIRRARRSSRAPRGWRGSRG